jgi:hypothetical protein
MTPSKMKSPLIDVVVFIVIKAILITVILLLTFSAGIHVGKKIAYDSIFKEVLANPIE